MSDAKVLGQHFTDEEHKALAVRLSKAIGVALEAEVDAALAETGSTTVAAPIVVTALNFSLKSFIESCVVDNAVRAALWQQYALQAQANRDAEIRLAALLKPGAN